MLFILETTFFFESNLSREKNEKINRERNKYCGNDRNIYAPSLFSPVRRQCSACIYDYNAFFEIAPLFELFLNIEMVLNGF